MVGVGAVIRGLPRTATYEEAMRIIAGLGGSAERLAQLQELRDARAEIDASLKAAEDAAAIADRRKSEADAVAETARQERDRGVAAQNAAIQAASKARQERDALATEARALESREKAHALAVSAATKAHAERSDALDARREALDAREAGVRTLEETAATDRAQAAMLKAEAERRLARIMVLAEGGG